MRERESSSFALARHPSCRSFASAACAIACVMSLRAHEMFVASKARGAEGSGRFLEARAERAAVVASASMDESAETRARAIEIANETRSSDVDDVVEVVFRSSAPKPQCDREHRFATDGFVPTFETFECDRGAVENPTRFRCAFRKLFYFESFCVGENIVVDTEAFDEYISVHRGSLNDPSNYAPVPFERVRGVLTSTGSCDVKITDTERYGGGGSGILATGFQAKTSAATKNRIIARETMTIYVIGGGYGSGNPWHELEQIVNMYELMLAHKMPKRGGRVLVFDSFKRTSADDAVKFHSPIYGELIRRVFSSEFPLSTMGLYIDEKRRESNISANDSDQSILFDRMAFVTSGGTSKLSRSGDSLGCNPSPVMTSFVSFVMDKLPEVKAVEATLDAVFVVRGSTTSHRQVVHSGYEALLKRVKNRPGVKVVDFAEVGDIIEQMKIVRSARAFVGVHGAGLTHALWMHEGSYVIEIAQEFRCHCYTAISDFAGHRYDKVEQHVSDEQFALMIMSKLGLL